VGENVSVSAIWLILSLPSRSCSGTIPYLVNRIAFASNAPALGNPNSPIEIIKQFKTFHYDTANVGISPAFGLTAAFVPKDKLVIGTDHPYAPTPMIKIFTDGVGEWKFTEEERRRLNEGNAMALFPRLS